jgi:hypothetical protein
MFFLGSQTNKKRMIKINKIENLGWKGYKIVDYSNIIMQCSQIL